MSPFWPPEGARPPLAGRCEAPGVLQFTTPCRPKELSPRSDGRREAPGVH
jgi:hypothetical protein